MPRSVAQAVETINAAERFSIEGRVTRLIGAVVEASSLNVAVGEVCSISGPRMNSIEAEVVGFHERGIMLMPYGDISGVHPGALVRALGRSAHVPVGDGLCGRVLDGLGRPIDGRGDVGPTMLYPLAADPPSPLERARISDPLSTGVRAIDALLTLGKGQRIGVFAGSGVGKSMLMAMIARQTSADVNVIALLGERGREVREFIDRDLGPEGLKRSVVVVSTSDQPALIRAKGAVVATAIAEFFRDQGKDVLLMVDSLTRIAMAWREVGLSVGEPPTTKGYPPSVFGLLPRLLERAGTGVSGSISGLYTVLVEGDDFNEPVSDAARSILDGHIVLSRRLAAGRHFPAIDVLGSVSRVKDAVIDRELEAAANEFLRLEAAYHENEDLITVGAYKAGTSPVIDTAIALRQEVLSFLRQMPNDRSTYESSRARLVELAAKIRGKLQANPAESK